MCVGMFFPTLRIFTFITNYMKATHTKKKRRNTQFLVFLFACVFISFFGGAGGFVCAFFFWGGIRI